MSTKKALSLLLALLLSISASSCLPSNNIRILVNNENLQSPPYLLEVFKSQQQAENNTKPSESSLPAKQEAKPPSSTTSSTSVKPVDVEPSQDSTTFASRLSKEESVEETLEGDYSESAELFRGQDTSASALRIHGDEPSNLDNGPASKPLSESQVNVMQPLAVGSVTKKPQTSLPVANSHLKKPSILVSEDDVRREEPASVSRKPPKSLVSATAVDEDFESNSAERAKVLKAKQVVDMSLAREPLTNNSDEPATLNRNYGNQNRTRVTFGGGYVRDRLPPLENPASGSYVDRKPEKPVTPLETASVVRSVVSKGESSNLKEESLLPERIILPDVEELSASFNNKSFVRDLKECPEKGVTTFPHPKACDRYFFCKDGYLSEQVCPNGLMYGTRETVRDFCIHRWLAQCDDKTIPNPISSPGCRWQFGIFNVQGSPKCTPDYYECSDGAFQVKKCSLEGQVYDDRTKSCQFAELAGCAKEALADFQCPPDDQANTYWPFPRYFLNERALIHCINDKPEIIRCTAEERVDPEHLHCVPLAKQSAQINLDSRNIRERKVNTTNSSR